MNNELRTLNTKNSIKKAFIKLVKEKSYSKVSIKDIALEANINRNTFYLHYENKDDLINSLVNDVANKLAIKFRTITHRIKFNSNRLSKMHIFIAVKAFLELLDEEDFYKLLLSDSSLEPYIEKIGYILKKELLNILSGKSEKSQIIAEFAYSGFIGSVQSWLLKKSCTENEFANILSNLLYQEIKEIIDSN